jgi:hypothetical protein
MWYTVGFLLLIAGSVVFFLALFPKPSEFISVFGEKIKESESAFSFFLSPFAPLNEGLIKALKVEKPLKNKMYLAKWKTTRQNLWPVKSCLP